MLEEKILKDYKAAMLAKDTAKSSILSFLRAQMQNLAKEKKKDKLEDKDVISVIKQEVKRHQDSIEQFKKGNRQDLVDKEAKELEILKLYLPKQLSDDELKKVIDEVVSSLGATDMKQMGQVMKEVMAKVGDSADGKMVSSLVKEKLAPPKEEQK
ncbi:MAG: GatB/YqeY domain-containing protein [Candidatus Omnitrophota bacterium]